MLWVWPCTAALAQTVRGKVVGEDGAAVVGASVSVRDATGALLGNTLTDTTGAYRIRMSRAAGQSIRVLRLGFGPADVALGPVVTDTVRIPDVVMRRLPAALRAVEVFADARCKIGDRDRADLVRLWGLVAAASSNRLIEMSQDLDIHVVEIDGSEDGPGIHVSARPSWVPPPNPGADSINAREWYSTSSLWSTPVAALAARGFVRREAGDLLVYDAPTPETLLSPWFQSGHCFRTEKAPRNNPGWIGIAFRPVADTESKTDVAGTLWVDRATGQLRRLDFTYEHQQFLPSTGCVVNRPPRPYCFRPLSYQFAGTGGWLEFASLPGGEWLVSTWVIRMPGLEFNDQYSGIKSRYVQGRFEECFQGSNCEKNYAIVPRLRTRSGAVATIHRRGQEIYRSDSVLAGLSRIATKQARTGGAHLGGTVTDAAGQPVEGSVVTIESPRRATITNRRGAFEFWNLPAASAVRVHIRRDGFLEETLDAFPVGDSSNDVHIQLRKAPRLPDTHPLDQRLVSRADMPAHTEQRTPSVG